MNSSLRAGGSPALLSLFFVILCLSASALAGPVVQTAEGPVSGFIEGETAYFRGIPYAQPPVGALRWKAPQPVEPRSGKLEATAFGPACPQRGYKGLVSEDCLTLNISVPTTAKPGEKLPVLVWIHGGGFVGGTGAAGMFDPRLWNANGVILVTFNYRLGALGFFAHEKLDSSHGVNYGLLDMVAALRWVNANIGAFGGDNTRVTIAGISAGGMAVQLLMTSPLSEGLFQGAISQSGYGTWPLPRSHNATPLKGSEAAASAADALAERALGKPKEEISTEDLYQSTPEQWINAVEGFYLPIVDGRSLKDEPGIVFQRGDQHPVPFISGGSSFDGSVFPHSGFAPETLLDMMGKYGAQATRLYDIKAPETDGRSIEHLFGDMRYLLSAYYSTKQMHKVNQRGYLYLFDYVPEKIRSKWPGAPHASEGSLLFKDNATPVIRDMRHYWINFMKTGNPNGADLPDWPAVTAAKVPWMVFSDKPVVKESVRDAKLNVIEPAYLERVNR